MFEDKNCYKNNLRKTKKLYPVKLKLEMLLRKMYIFCDTHIYIWSLFFQNPEEGGGSGKKFSFKSISARIRGEDTSYEAQLATAERELKEAEDNLNRTQKEFE